MELAGGRKKLACIIGLDGVPFDLLRSLAADGTMPAMGRLINQGQLCRMKASLPEVSSVSWTSFMTGTNPGTHGIFGFTDLRDHSYQVRFPNFADVKTPTIWDRLGELGLKSVVINQPSTYPARKIEGALVSGFVVVELARAVFPLSHLAALEKMGYEVDVDTQRAREDREYLWRALDSTLGAGRRAFRYFWSQEWNLFELIVTGTDRLHHYAWEAVASPAHPERSRFLEYYVKVDRLIEEIVGEYERLSGGIEGLCLLSDHGFAGIEQEVYLNAWLERAGFLRFDTDSPQRLGELAPGTRAFALDPNRIYLNLKGRFPRGVVDRNDRKTLKQDLTAGLRELEYQGRRVIREVFDAEDIYSGAQVPNGPDLVALGETGFDLKGALGTKEVFGRSGLQGMHTWDDAFFWSPRKCAPNLVISDLAALIMERFL